MSKSKATIIIIILILLVVGGFFAFYYFYLSPNNTPSPSPSPSLPQTIITPSQKSQNSPAPSNTPQQTTQNNQNSSLGTTTNNVALPSPLPILRQISKEPSAGAITFLKNIGTKKKPVFQTIIRYIDKINGHVHETRTDTLDTQDISTTRIPKIYEALWAATGNTLYARYLNDTNETIQTFYGQLRLLPPATSANANSSLNPPSSIVYAQQELQGIFLDQDLKEFVLPPSSSLSSGVNQNNIFYLITKYNQTAGILARNDGSHPIQIFSSPVTEWLSSWPKDNIITLTTKPSYLTQGALYFLNTNTQSFTKILGGHYGLTTLTSPDTNTVLYSQTSNGNLSTSLYSIKNAQTTNLLQSTLPEKCVWSKKSTTVLYCAIPKNLSSGNYPDDWYQGLFSFNDEIEKIDTKTGQITILADPVSMVKVNMDIIKPFLTENEDYLFFTNKNDSILWSLKL